jgi:hypothetical protein
MSEALRKNEAALVSLLGRNDLGGRLQDTRIGIWTDPAGARLSGALLAEALGDVLGRFWRHLDVAGPLADGFLRAAREAAASGGQPQLAATAWNPPYDAVVSIGVDPPANCGPAVTVGAAGWKALFGPRAFVDEDPNPVGPTAAAAIAASEIFKRRFADALGERAVALPEDYEWSAWDYGLNDAAPVVQPITVDDLHIIGAGAVTHALLWILQRWPCTVAGRAYVIDPDKYSESNGQRYAGMRASDLHCDKAERIAVRLHEQFPRLEVVPRVADMNQFFETERPDCRVRLVVIGVDSAEHRRQLALKLPRRVINIWTEGEWLGSARFGFSDGWPCLCCVYPEDASAPLDETGQFAQETGLPPARVRALLFSTAGLNEEDVSVLRQKYPLVDSQGLVGKPLRTVRGILCATARIRLQESGAEVDVPLAFCSLLAGVGGAVELLHEVWGAPSVPGRWKLRAFSYPVPGHWQPDGKRSTCYLCSDPLTAKTVAGKYV